jgi:hypothetical protein
VGAFAPPALKGVDNSTFAHRPLARPVDKQSYPPHALPPFFESFFPFSSCQTEQGEPLPKDSGGAQPHGGLGAAWPPAVGAEGGAGRAGGRLYPCPPSGGA